MKQKSLQIIWFTGFWSFLISPFVGVAGDSTPSEYPVNTDILIYHICHE